jgi:hypothetical protein
MGRLSVGVQGDRPLGQNWSQWRGHNRLLIRERSSEGQDVNATASRASSVSNGYYYYYYYYGDGSEVK